MEREIERDRDRETLTSLVFHLCRWVGKLSDLGRDSRLSGSLIGSPSEHGKYHYKYLSFKFWHSNSMLCLIDIFVEFKLIVRALRLYKVYLQYLYYTVYYMSKKS